MPASPIPIDSLLWHATRYSDVLKLDRRLTAQALETAPSQTHNGIRVWHLSDGFRAIAPLVAAKSHKLDPSQMDPKEQLDYYRAQREKIKLAEDIRKMLPASAVERTIGEAFKVLAQTLDALPDTLERDCALPATVIAAVQRSIDAARENLYATLVAAMDGTDG